MNTTKSVPNQLYNQWALYIVNQMVIINSQTYI